jgi:HK97 family phage prohead protease
MTLEQKIDKYIDGKAKLLDPRSRDIAPSEGDMSCVELAVRKVDEANRTIEAIVSTADVDRYQEIVEPKAYRKWLKHFKANPVMLAAHDHSAWSTGDPTVIGKWLDIQITDSGLLAVGQFMADDELAEKYWKRYRDGFMKAFSVGFIAHSSEMREFELAPGVSKRLRVFTEVELLEISAVAVPANRQALARAASFIAGGRAAGTGDDENAARAFEEMLARLLKQELSREDNPIVKQLADPDGPVALMIEEVMQRAADHEGLRRYFDPDTPGHKSGEKAGGNDELKRELRQLVGG